MKSGELGIQKLLGVHHYVRDLARSRALYTGALGFDEVGRSSPDLTRRGRQRSLVFRAGEIVAVCSTPSGKGGRADRYLEKHPDGIGTLAFEVDDVHRTFAVLDANGGTPITEIEWLSDDWGKVGTFSITTPFGDTTFRFVERHDYRGLFPGLLQNDVPRGKRNDLGFTEIDHVTTNFRTMKPALLWLEHVLGFEPLWEVEFHTRDAAKYRVRDGSGLRSKVMWDPHSGVKFANNEPYRPYFARSQINVFHEEHRGDGVQHLALGASDIVSAVRKLRGRGVPFMPTPRTYYDLLPARLEELGVGDLDEDLRTLEELEILVDGSAPHSYLLQIFLKDCASLHGSPDAGPFFYEIIQRKGDRGFGTGNFRALFESIEREQALARSA